jgi:3D (Asp-Asp-Asp) domain-containing protein
MRVARSIAGKLTITLVAIAGFLLLYEATVSDSRTAATQAALRESTASPSPGARLRFSATAYCKGTTTASGVSVKNGVAAADPDLLPSGSVIHIDSLPPRYNGVYTILDTGPTVQGRHIDLYLWSCHEALDFGRRMVRLTVLRLGWNPRASTPSLIDVLFRRREATAEQEPEPLPSRPLELPPADTPR